MNRYYNSICHIMSSTNSSARTLGILDRSATLYPGGIPKALIRARSTRVSIQALHCALVVVSQAPLGAELLELAKAICTKGLKLSLDLCKIDTVSREELASQDSIKALVTRQGADVVIICGGSATGGKLVEFPNGLSALLTYSLDEVASDTEKKRLFWGDIKLILPRLAC